MKYNYNPKNNLEKFGTKVYSALVENFSQTFFVGGMVRDLLLKRKIVDIDIATEATPDEIIKCLSSAGISCSDAYKKFGNIIATQNNYNVEITTFRKDLKGHTRYRMVSLIKKPKTDSYRRDFTINGLYLSENGQIFDYHNGLFDLKKRLIKFIGNPKQRIQEDPLRIVRALRFALVLNFNLEKNAKLEIKNNFDLIKNITKTKLEKEKNKILNKRWKEIIKKVINNPKLLDKYFK